MPSVLDRINAGQEHFLELVVSWQEPVVAAVLRTTKAVEEQAAKLPKVPLVDKFHLDKLHLDKLPTPAQFVESQFAFVQKLLDNSRRSSGASATTDEAPAEEAAQAADEVVIDLAPEA